MQTTTQVKPERGSLFRSRKPFAIGLGTEGAGFGISMGSRVSIEVTTFILSWAANGKFLILNKNGTPYLGFGFGGFRSAGGSNSSWSVFCAGWQQDYNSISIELGVKITLATSPDHGDTPFPASFAVWYRI
jgi:hypothetical protein